MERKCYRFSLGFYDLFYSFNKITGCKTNPLVQCHWDAKNLRLIYTPIRFNYKHSLGGELANKLPVFVPPVNTHAPVVFAAFNNPFRISFRKWKKMKEKQMNKIGAKVSGGSSRSISSGRCCSENDDSSSGSGIGGSAAERKKPLPGEFNCRCLPSLSFTSGLVCKAKSGWNVLQTIFIWIKALTC